jgi:hypothetical protein
MPGPLGPEPPVGGAGAAPATPALGTPLDADGDGKVSLAEAVGAL